MVKIVRIDSEQLRDYSSIPNYFQVNKVFLVEPIYSGLKGLKFNLVEVEPYTKWKEQPDDSSNPLNWARTFDISCWGIFVAYDGDTPVGGVAVGSDAPIGFEAYFEDKNSATLWDIRVHPDWRLKGVASKLFNQVLDWARKMGFKRLRMEVTSHNVPMCRFMVKHKSSLAAVHLHGYETEPDVSEESMLIWYYDLLAR
jgi:GNAT superfamily N-acetyltransferase